MIRLRRLAPIVVLLALFGGSPASAQAAPDGRAPLVEGSVGYLGFIDEVLIDHLVVSGSARWYVTPRIAVGPEIAYLRGPGIDRDWVVTGNATLDLGPASAGRPRRAVPYVLAGGGFSRSRLQVGTGPFINNEGALTGGLGVRIGVGPRW
jgi:hypothetical protein